MLLGLLILAWMREPAIGQEPTVTEQEAAGILQGRRFQLTRTSTGPGSSVTGASLYVGTLDAKALKALKSLPKLENLTFYGTTISEAAAKGLGDLPALTSLQLNQ